VKNVYITVWRIYSGQYTPNFIRIRWVSFKIWQKHFYVFFSSQCRTLFYVNIYGCYKLLKTVRFLAHPVYW